MIQGKKIFRKWEIPGKNSQQKKTKQKFHFLKINFYFLDFFSKKKFLIIIIIIRAKKKTSFENNNQMMNEHILCAFKQKRNEQNQMCVSVCVFTQDYPRKKKKKMFGKKKVKYKFKDDVPNIFDIDKKLDKRKKKPNFVCLFVFEVIFEKKKK